MVAVAAVCAAFILAPADLAAQPGTGAHAPRTDASGTYAKHALVEINAARTAHGMRRLRLDARLTRASAAHARSMGQRGFFSHSSASGSSAADRIRRYYNGSAVGEVILWRAPDLPPHAAVAAWLASPSHRHVLLHRRFRHIGIVAMTVPGAPGVYGGLDVTIVVADLGAP
jgi:uncharacterized protein YkwD